jgi:phenylpropionate dioxygenase-like ring-hydroxylating dioxygenase large terminal subunit
MQKELNERITRVGPDTPGGRLLRRYWWPIAIGADVTDKPYKVRLLGEDFVVFRSLKGRLGLLDLHCAHRNASLEFGRVEENGLRCCYHGWLYDENGHCLDQMCEPNGGHPYREKIRQGAYSVTEQSGLIFAYIGPSPAPPFPKWDILADDKCNKFAQGRDMHSNWVQRAENMLDALHVMALHASVYPELAEARPDKVEYLESWYGVDMRLEYPNGVRDRHHFMFPACNRIQVARSGQRPHQFIQWATPVDDTKSISFQIWAQSGDPPPYKVTGAKYQATVAGEYRRVEDGWWGIWERDQDDAAVDSQGPIADRSREHLASSDQGIVKFRRMLVNAIDAIERGEPAFASFPPNDEIVELETYKTLGDDGLRIRNPDLGRKLEIIQPYDLK